MRQRKGGDVGNRANFVIVKDQEWQLYYSHWAGYRILDALIGGPQLALRYTKSLRQCAKDQWVDQLWADGGAVVDLDRRRVLFFGDELMARMQERRALVSVLAAVWPDYAIRWAYDGTAELAGYVGVELPPHTWDKQPKLRLARDRNALCHLVSVVDATGQLRMWPLWWHLSQAWHGPHVDGQAARPRCSKLDSGQDPGRRTPYRRSPKNAGSVADRRHDGCFPGSFGPMERLADGVLGRSLRGTGGSMQGRSADSRSGLSRRRRQRSGVAPQ